MSEMAAQIVTAVSPPSAVTMWFCPSCGREVRGKYNIDQSRKKCSQTWHKGTPCSVRYIRAGKGR